MNPNFNESLILLILKMKVDDLTQIIWKKLWTGALLHNFIKCLINELLKQYSL